MEQNKRLKNRLAEILVDIGLTPRPTEGQLEAWNMTFHRWNQLLKNTGKEMTLAESVLLKKWLESKFTGKNTYLFESEMPASLRNKQGALPL